MNQKKKIFFHFYAQILAKRFDRFFEFSNFSILTIFDDDLLPLNRVSRKKVTFHERSPRKDEDFVHGVILCQLVHCLDPTSVDMTQVKNIDLRFGTNQKFQIFAEQ